MLAKINPSSALATVLYTAPTGRKPQVTVTMVNVSAATADVQLGIISGDDRGIAAVTFTEGGSFLTKPNVIVTTTGTAPTTAAALVVGTMGARSVVITAGGSGFAVNQVLTVAGGTATTATQIRVDVIDVNGVITAASVLTAGVYSALPTNPVSVTGGTGTLATFTLMWTILSITVSVGGNGYTPLLNKTTVATAGVTPSIAAVLTLQFAASFEPLTDSFHPTTTLPVSGVVERSGIVMDAGDTLVVRSSIASAVNFFAMGYEDLA